MRACSARASTPVADLIGPPGGQVDYKSQLSEKTIYMLTHYESAPKSNYATDIPPVLFRP